MEMLCFWCQNVAIVKHFPHRDYQKNWSWQFFASCHGNQTSRFDLILVKNTVFGQNLSKITANSDRVSIKSVFIINIYTLDHILSNKQFGYHGHILRYGFTYLGCAPPPVQHTMSKYLKWISEQLRWAGSQIGS